MFDTQYDRLHIFKPNGPVNHTAIAPLLETTLHAGRPAARAAGTAISEANHRTTTTVAIASLEPTATTESMHATQIAAAHATGMRVLHTAGTTDAARPEKRRLASLALGFPRFAQTATRSLEKCQAVRRSDHLDYPTGVAVLRRTMEDALDAFGRDWERAHTTRRPSRRTRRSPGPHRPQHRMAGKTPCTNSQRRPPRLRPCLPRRRITIRMASKTPCNVSGISPRPGIEQHGHSRAGQLRQAAKQGNGTTDAHRYTSMVRVRHGRSRRLSHQAPLASRAGSVAPVPSVCIGVHRWFQILASPPAAPRCRRGWSSPPARTSCT